jgi:hypothetical protein
MNKEENRMNRKRLFALLIALMLIATWLPALADWTYTEQKNEDGSTIIISTDENGVVRNKSYVKEPLINEHFESLSHTSPEIFF